MRIYSAFFDYYDSVASSWADDDTQYRRVETIVELTSALAVELGCPEVKAPSWQWTEGARMLMALIGFCGRFYPYVLATNADGSQQFLQTFPEVTSWDPVARYLERQRRHRWYKHREPELLFLETPPPPNDAPFLALGVPLFHVFWQEEPNEGRRRTYRRWLTTNAFLRPLEFYRVVDAQTAYQEIERYLANTLTSHDEPSDIADTDKLLQHGFDKRLSFRKGKPLPPPRAD